MLELQKCTSVELVRVSLYFVMVLKLFDIELVLKVNNEASISLFHVGINAPYQEAYAIEKPIFPENPPVELIFSAALEDCKNFPSIFS